jgi:hypothetical protein
MTRRAGLAFFLFSCAGPTLAQPQGDFLGPSECRVANLVPVPAEPIHWKGACKDGYADGKGVLEWHPAGKAAIHVEGVMTKGQFNGEATLTTADGHTYIGTLRDGQPHGKGYFKFPDGMQYEGSVANGAADGTGVAVWPAGDRYEGAWKQGKREGYGRATFALGGSYEGEWKHDQFDGRGTIVYAGSGRKFTGDFSDGRPAGLPPRPPVSDVKYSLKADETETGTNLKKTITVTSFPLDLGWAKMSPQQRESIKSYYPALEEGDEPPYPEQGIKPVLMSMRETTRTYDLADSDITILVTVEPDGKASAASTMGDVNDKVRYFASVTAMAQRYKPAKCHGQPCRMVFGYRFKVLPSRASQVLTIGSIAPVPPRRVAAREGDFVS